MKFRTIAKTLSLAASIGIILLAPGRVAAQAAAPSPLDAWIPAVKKLDVPLPKPKAVYNVKDFGAKGDGQTKDTPALQKALDTCAVNGGGEVDVPAGDYYTGSIQIGNNTILHLLAGSTLYGSEDFEDYPIMDVRWEGRWIQGQRSLIYAANVDHIGIIGPGQIVGDSITAASNSEPRGSLVIEPISCNDVHFEGFTVTQPGNNWCTHPTYCTDVLYKNVTIIGNRDGIDVDSTKNIYITDCNITTGDDCVSIKSGRGMNGARLGKPTENVLITNCAMVGRSFQCVGIGSEISGGVRNLHVEHCSMTANSYAIYLKTAIGRAGTNENISGNDLDILGGDFIRINLVSGGNNNTAADPVDGLIGYPIGRNIRFFNIRLGPNVKAILTATAISRKRPLDGLVLSNISGTAATGIQIANANGVELSNITVTGFTGPLLSIAKVTGKGLEGATTVPAPVDPDDTAAVQAAVAVAVADPVMVAALKQVTDSQAAYSTALKAVMDKDPAVKSILEANPTIDPATWTPAPARGGRGGGGALGGGGGRGGFGGPPAAAPAAGQ